MKKYIKRTTYLGYYIKKLDYSTFNKFITYASHKTGISKFSLWVDAIKSIYKYNIGLMDYFIFRFYEKSHIERSKWVGTGYKYEFDLKTNPLTTRAVLEDKIKFYETYTSFIKHSYCTIDDLTHDKENAQDVLNNKSGKIVIKDSLGQCGWNVEVVNSLDYTSSGDLVEYMKKKGFNLAEEFIQQHEEINRLSSSGLNTVRMITMINNEGGVDILGARMRISVNSPVDNLASGNIACPIDLDTGKIIGQGVYSDITKDPVKVHPITGVNLIGFKIPMWDEIMEATRNIALHKPENRGVGWDVAVTEKGPDFIEGNHNWCKILWQIPVNEGLRHILEKYK